LKPTVRDGQPEHLRQAVHEAGELGASARLGPLAEQLEGGVAAVPLAGQDDGGALAPVPDRPSDLTVGC
jgi:hypothetical protein